MESFEAAVEAAGAWIDGSRVTVINVETVTLPSLYSPKEEGSSDPELMAGQVSLWYQFVRVWYRT